MDKNDIIFVIIAVVAIAVLTIVLLSDKSKKRIKLLSVQKLKIELKYSKNILILGFVLLLISFFIWIFHNFRISSLFLALFPIYISILNIWITKRAIKDKEQEELLND